MKSLRSTGTSCASRSEGGPHGRQVLERAVEKRRLGQHRHRGGAGGGVVARDRRRIVVGAQHPARRRPPLALGDHVDPVAPADRVEEPSSRSTAPRPFPRQPERPSREEPPAIRAAAAPRRSGASPRRWSRADPRSRAVPLRKLLGGRHRDQLVERAPRVSPDRSRGTRSRDPRPPTPPRPQSAARRRR